MCMCSPYNCKVWCEMVVVAVSTSLLGQISGINYCIVKYFKGQN